MTINNKIEKKGEEIKEFLNENSLINLNEKELDDFYKLLDDYEKLLVERNIEYDEKFVEYGKKNPNASESEINSVLEERGFTQKLTPNEREVERLIVKSVLTLENAANENLKVYNDFANENFPEGSRDRIASIIVDPVFSDLNSEEKSKKIRGEFPEVTLTSKEVEQLNNLIKKSRNFQDTAEGLAYIRDDIIKNRISLEEGYDTEAYAKKMREEFGTEVFVGLKNHFKEKDAEEAAQKERNELAETYLQSYIDEKTAELNEIENSLPYKNGEFDAVSEAFDIRAETLALKILDDIEYDGNEAELLAGVFGGDRGISQQLEELGIDGYALSGLQGVSVNFISGNDENHNFAASSSGVASNQVLEQKAEKFNNPKATESVSLP